MTLRALTGEIRKNLLLMWSYRFSMIFDVFGYSTLYVAAMYFIGRGEFQQAEMEVDSGRFSGHIFCPGNPQPHEL